MSVKQNILQIQSDISLALTRRQPGGNFVSEDVKIIAVTKNHPIEKMIEALDAGIHIVGENRVQEAKMKYDQMNVEKRLSWHLVGHLQTNKAKQAVEMFDLIHSVDSERLALAINNAAEKADKRQDILVQINVGEEDSKHGIVPALKETAEFAVFISQLKNLKLCGLMTMAPFYDSAEEARPVFKELKRLFDGLVLMNIPNTELKWLSMGMTHDYIVAIEEGANMVRIGTGIFGVR
jgi:hypothetical protein